MNHASRFLIGVVMISLMMTGCSKKITTADPFNLNQDQVFQTTLSDIRLGDGVPLKLIVSVRWKIDDKAAFISQFKDPSTYATQVLLSKSRETANKIANTYNSVDAVFTSDREKFVQAIKSGLQNTLGEKGITVKEVIFSDIVFPGSFTEAVEKIAMQERMLDAIRQQNTIDLAKVKAEESKAEADGRVEIKRAETQGKVAEINAKAEEKKRVSELARAETEALVAERRAKGEAEKKKLMDQAEVDREKAYKDLAIQKQKELDNLELQKEKELAELCANNPSYASFLVNKELASKIQIAVLPVGTEAGILGNMLQGTMLKPAQKKEK